MENIASIHIGKFQKSVNKCFNKKKCKNSDIEIDQLHEHLASLFGGNTEENRNVVESTFEYVEDDDLDSPISEQE